MHPDTRLRKKSYLCPSKPTIRTMKKRIGNMLRILSAVLLLLAGVYGYVCQDRTLIVWWYPVAAALGAALCTMPMVATKWRILTRSDDATVNRLCHLAAAGTLLYCAFMAGNYHLADPASERSEQVVVARKFRKERHRSHRVGRRMVRAESYEVYYLELVFDDGRHKTMQVARSVYASSRENSQKTVEMRQGYFGFPVIRRIGAPTTALRPAGTPNATGPKATGPKMTGSR